MHEKEKTLTQNVHAYCLYNEHPVCTGCSEKKEVVKVSIKKIVMTLLEIKL